MTECVKSVNRYIESVLNHAIEIGLSGSDDLKTCVSIARAAIMHGLSKEKACWLIDTLKSNGFLSVADIFMAAPDRNESAKIRDKNISYYGYRVN